MSVGYRYAPIAQRETYDGTPIQTGITDIAVSRKKAYVTFRRWGGSGWGSIQRLDLQVQEHGAWRSLTSAKDAVRTLGSVEEVSTTSGGLIRLCGSSDGQRVYYGDDQVRKNYLIVDDSMIKP